MHARVIKPSCLLLLLLSMANRAIYAQAKFSLPINPSLTNITRMEYYVDSDPGFGNGTAVPITAGTSVSTTTAAILPSSLSKGLHNLFFRSQDANGHWSLPNVQTINIFSFLATPTPNASPQNITALEYFVDTDPGFGKATSIPITAANDVSGNVAISLSGLSKGVHRLFARSKDMNGNWSISSQQNLFVLNFAGTFPANASAKAITNLEYFMDVDPGFGNGTTIPIASGVDVTASNITVPITTLSNGMHKLYARSKDVSGNWSLPNITPLYVAKLAGSLGANASVSNITAMEYFFDADPGFGKATSIPIAMGIDITASNVAIPVASLSKGIHQLFVRSKNANGAWSITLADAINVFSLMSALPGNVIPSTITSLEYFTDIDPGFGKGTPVPITAGTDITASNIAVSISGLSAGTHTLYARTKTATGWSLSGFSQFFIVKPIGILPNNSTLGNVTALEYFFDTDPGFGKANPASVSAANDVVSNVAVPLIGLNKGIHKLVFRSKNANGNWSISNSQSLLIYNVLSSLPSTASASNITAIEYFMDSDPGFGNATPMPITAGIDVTASNIAIPVSGLSNGLHRLFVRSKNANGNWSLSSAPPFFIAKLISNLASNAVPANIVSMEYFLDTDPGFNNATPIPIVAGADVSAANVTVSLGNLSKGIHRLFVRSQDAAGHWSITNVQSLLIYVPVGQLPTNSTPANIAAMEYFMDSDPGFGKAISIPFTAGSDVTGNMVIDITNLPKGLHHLFVRSKDVAGKWSITNTQNINIFSIISGLPNNANASAITAMEYFMDNDPGFGNGTSIPIAAGTDVTASNVAVPLATNLSAGIHRLFVRTENANGSWSLANLTQFFLTKTIGGLPSSPSTANIVAMEYFMDNDPGFGNATNVPVTAGNDVTASNIAIPIANNLSVGIHKIYVRTQNANGNWSLSNFSQFFFTKAIGNLPSNQAVANVAALEYFFDVDPGYGNATSIPVTVATDVSTNIAIPITSLSNGFHHLFVRSKANNGVWSITNVLPVAVISLMDSLPNNSSLQNIAAMEYFVDKDPGFGLATTIAITSANDVSVANYAIALSNLSIGFHRIYVRSKADNGIWSITNKQNVFVMGNIGLPNTPATASITKLEYFVDTDPGFGNATQVSVPATADLSNFKFDVSLGNIADGNHYLFVRTYDAWGLTNVVPFKVGNSQLPVTWLSFSTKLVDNNSVLLNWQTANEVNNMYFAIERSANGVQFDSIGTVQAQNLQTTISSYNFIDKKPLPGISYYRIKQVDKDGKFTYSVIVAIRISGFSDIHVAPNPFRDAFTVQLSAAQQGEATVRLMDASGKYLLTKSVGLMAGANTLHLDGLGKLAAGSYILIVNNNSETATIKLIKE